MKTKLNSMPRVLVLTTFTATQAQMNHYPCSSPGTNTNSLYTKLFRFKTMTIVVADLKLESDVKAIAERYLSGKSSRPSSRFGATGDADSRNRNYSDEVNINLH